MLELVPNTSITSLTNVELLELSIMYSLGPQSR